MDDATYIIGLMKSATDAVGFIPSTSVRRYWVAKGFYVLQTDARGRPRGYLLHGPPTSGRPLKIHQALIDYDYRLHGFGILAVREVVKRACLAQATAIHLRCAFDLPANAFWHACGFHAYATEQGGKRRNRTIVLYELPLRPIPNAAALPPDRVLSCACLSSSGKGGTTNDKHKTHARGNGRQTWIGDALRLGITHMGDALR